MLSGPLLALALAAGPDLLTTAERSGFERTGRHDEARALCAAHAKAFPRRARCFTFGETPEGRPLVALAASADGVLDPAAARARRRPVVLFHGAIHAGELDGKDAGFIALRPLLASKDGGALAKVTAVFVPVYNVDGHERFGPHQRPNQRGPAEGGWRTTARNLNLNRDYTKADAPETRAMLRLLGEWDPIVYADLHVTDGAKFEHDVSIMVEPRHGWDASLRPAGEALSAALVERLTARGHLPLDFYPSFVDERDPSTTGFERGVAPPRFSQSYWAARNRLGVLYEAHSWRPYAHRVKTAVAFLDVLLALAAEHGQSWREAAARADLAAGALAGREVTLAWAASDAVETLPFRAYAFEKPRSIVTGTPVVAYDEARPETWRVPIRGVKPALTVKLPRGGWIVPAAHAGPVGELLALHGVRHERMAAGRAGLEVEAYRADEVQFGATPTDGRQRLTVKGAWRPERREVAPGSLWVPAAQPRAVLAASLLEPEAPDSLLAWGTFNAHFVRSEYVEPYVLELFAKELFARDPGARAEFEQAFPPDSPTPAGAPARVEVSDFRDPRLDWIARRHPSWDEAYRLYPVLRAAARP